MVVVHLVLASITAVVYGLLAALLGRRRSTPEARPALNLFRTWWFALAIITALDPLQVALFTLDALPIWLHETLAEASLLVLAAGLWGLLGYLIYAYSGSRRSWRPLAAIYALAGVLLLAILNRAGTPESLVILHGEVEAVPGIELPAFATALILTFLVGPQLAAAAAYARLYWRADTPTQRYRIALVSMALIGWLGASLAGAFLDAGGGAWEYTTRLLGLTAALLVLAAYFPPRFVQRRFGVSALGHESVEQVAFSASRPASRPYAMLASAEPSTSADAASPAGAEPEQAGSGVDASRETERSP